MTSELSTAQIQEIGQKLAQLYVDQILTEVVTRYEAITEKAVTPKQKITIRQRALDEFNAWFEAVKEN